VIRKREPRWQSAAERARVAAELIEEAESLTDTSTIASPADVVRAGLPPPVTAELPVPIPVLASSVGTEPLADQPAQPAALTLDDLLASDPDNVALLVQRAGALAAAGHYSAARRDFEHAVRQDPAHGEALAGLGILLSRKGLWAEAIPRLRQAAEVDAGRAGAWYYLGEALNRVDDLDGARTAYERAVELEPSNVKALYGLGIVLDRLNRPDEATRMYRRSREATGR
jgi:Flp pilus assembly protein TadD